MSATTKTRKQLIDTLKTKSFTISGNTASDELGNKITFNEKSARVENAEGTKTYKVSASKGYSLAVTAFIEGVKASRLAIKDVEDVDNPKVENTTKTETPKKGKETMTTKTAEKPELNESAIEKAKIEQEKAAEIIRQAAIQAKIGIALPKPEKKDFIFDTLLKAADKDEKTKEEIKSLWATFGKQFEYKTANLTQQLLAEGKWSCRVHPTNDKTVKDGLAGKPMADADGKQIPEGYKKVYLAEVAEGIKGVGHAVNTASAAFGRIVGEQRKAEEKAKEEAIIKAGGTIEPKPVDTKKIGRQIENLLAKLDFSQKLDFLNTSKELQEVMKSINEENTALESLDETDELAGL